MIDRQVEDRLTTLSDHDTLARRIWEYYVETMRSDGIIGITDTQFDWDNMSEAVRLNFIDSVRVNVCDSAIRLIDSLTSFDVDAIELMPHAKEATVGRQDPTNYACYMCSVNKATRFSSDGTIPICTGCSV